MEENNFGFYLVAIVGIVAVVTLVLVSINSNRVIYDESYAFEDVVVDASGNANAVVVSRYTSDGKYVPSAEWCKKNPNDRHCPRTD